MRPPFPVTIAPLLPQFLTRRNAKLDFVLRAIDEHRVDRPTIGFIAELWHGPEQGSTVAQINNAAYWTVAPWLASAAAATGAGLAEEVGGRWRLTERGAKLARDMRAAARAHHGTLHPIPDAELSELAALLERAFQASATSLDGDENAHLPRASRYRRGVALDAAFAQLDAAIYGLWMVRDDAHMTAWRAAGIDGPALDVLTRVWREEATSEEDLRAKLIGQSPADVRASLERLRAAGSLAAGDALRVTDAGHALRQRIENETDRLFFSPWPDEVGARSGWIEDRLRAVNQALI